MTESNSPEDNSMADVLDSDIFKNLDKEANNYETNDRKRSRPVSKASEKSENSENDYLEDPNGHSNMISMSSTPFTNKFFNYNGNFASSDLMMLSNSPYSNRSSINRRFSNFNSTIKRSTKKSSNGVSNEFLFNLSSSPSKYASKSTPMERKFAERVVASNIATPHTGKSIRMSDFITDTPSQKEFFGEFGFSNQGSILRSFGRSTPKAQKHPQAINGGKEKGKESLTLDTDTEILNELNFSPFNKNIAGGSHSTKRKVTRLSMMESPSRTPFRNSRVRFGDSKEMDEIGQVLMNFKTPKSLRKKIDGMKGFYTSPLHGNFQTPSSSNGAPGGLKLVKIDNDATDDEQTDDETDREMDDDHNNVSINTKETSTSSIRLSSIADDEGKQKLSDHKEIISQHSALNIGSSKMASQALHYPIPPPYFTNPSSNAPHLHHIDTHQLPHIVAGLQPIGPPLVNMNTNSFQCLPPPQANFIDGNQDLITNIFETPSKQVKKDDNDSPSTILASSVKKMDAVLLKRDFLTSPTPLNKKADNRNILLSGVMSMPTMGVFGEHKPTISKDPAPNIEGQMLQTQLQQPVNSKTQEISSFTTRTLKTVSVTDNKIDPSVSNIGNTKMQFIFADIKSIESFTNDSVYQRKPIKKKTGLHKRSASTNSFINKENFHISKPSSGAKKQVTAKRPLSELNQSNSNAHNNKNNPKAKIISKIPLIQISSSKSELPTTNNSGS
ncbi:hypothetical protein DASC09_038350 [Saccharomycopsis crataegensis]|uniref:Uncharacterized protein n=1 Tax=Saccharomycopsis crataegensis TaxID=43959 RepID=A0AAV5QPM2_9ASCO|nr:hypothetical protein DASC09_038350 [Saccharomycopsis crataegensis]